MTDHRSGVRAAAFLRVSVGEHPAQQRRASGCIYRGHVCTLRQSVYSLWGLGSDSRAARAISAAAYTVVSQGELFTRHRRYSYSRTPVK